MGVLLEFMAYRGIGTLEHAVSVVSAVGQPNLAITLDVLHFCRSGGTVDSLPSIDSKLIGCIQLCDGPASPALALPTEARYERLYPGEGDLPVHEIVAALPSDIPLSVEVPSRSRAHLSVAERANEGARWARQLLSAVDLANVAGEARS
jgi:sugar phosphate isomerase/epimerase